MVFPDVWGDLEPRFSVQVDSTKGRVRLPRLAEGHYLVVARAEQMLQATLYLGILPDGGNKTSTFSMQLSNCALAENPSEMLARAEQMPIRDRVHLFDGIVYDPSGATVAGAAIHVVRKGTEGKDRVAALKSDAKGHFSAQLQEGYYIAFFSMPGFRTTIAPFEVTKDGAGELRITLQVASTA
jgi:Carboxypeptidase regulatory-like domain